MVSALDSGAEPWPGTLCCVHGQDTLLSVPLSTQVYKWVPANCWGNLAKLRGSALRWTSIPSRGSRNTSSRFMLQKPGQAPAAMSQPWLQGFARGKCEMLKMVMDLEN